MRRYDYHRPSTVKEALELLAATPGAKLILGGTDLMVQMKKQRGLRPPALVSLRAIDSLHDIVDQDNALRIGAAAPLAEIAAHASLGPTFPALAQAIDVIGSSQIRNVATLAGNLCNASPGADSAPPLLVHEARVELQSRGGSREIALRDFFRGPGETALEPGEILTAVIVPHPAKGARSIFLRKGRVTMDLAVASVAVLLELDEDVCQRARIAAGAVAPVPLRLEKTESILEGSTLDPDTIARAAAAASAEVSPITDVRSTEEYRRELVGVYTKRGILRLLSSAVAA
jgi:carbon-monoxide dehydrogenase medium subunit